MRRRNGHRDQDLALALARLEAAFGPVQVLQVRPNPHPAGQQHPQGKVDDETGQAVLDLDGSPTGGAR